MLEEVAVVGVFVVDRQQSTVFATPHREQAHAVVVVAELHLLSLGGTLATRVERRTARSQRLAPTDQYRGRVTCWQADAVGGGSRNALEAEQSARRRADAVGQSGTAEQVAAEKHRSAAQCARADETAAGEADLVGADQVFQVSGLVFF